MATAKELQNLVDRVRSGALPTGDVRDLLHHQSPLVRANALEALVAPARYDEAVLDQLIAAASDPVNKAPLMGTTSVAHVAVRCILSVGTDMALEAARALVNAWLEPNRGDLIWYLNSEGLEVW